MNPKFEKNIVEQGERGWGRNVKMDISAEER